MGKPLCFIINYALLPCHPPSHAVPTLSLQSHYARSLCCSSLGRIYIPGGKEKPAIAEKPLSGGNYPFIAAEFITEKWDTIKMFRH